MPLRFPSALSLPGALLRRVLVAGLLVAGTPAHAFTDEEVVDGFLKTVFGSEYGLPFAGGYVRKFTGPVRFHIRSRDFPLRRAQVASFVERIDRLVFDLSARVVNREEDANFIVHVVPRRRYESVVRQRVLGENSTQPVPGRCMVRAVFTTDGIERSEAVIVGDEGDPLFSRCMTEEILQGLGPLNDDTSLKHSMFNDTSPFTTWRRFDRLILNMLYDPRIAPGERRWNVAPKLPAILRDVKQRIARSG